MTEYPQAPNINNNFPSQGERLSPAWNHIWAILAEPGWHDRYGLATLISEQHPIKYATAVSLMQYGVKFGLLRKREVTSGKRKRVVQVSRADIPIPPQWGRESLSRYFSM